MVKLQAGHYRSGRLDEVPRLDRLGVSLVSEATRKDQEKRIKRHRYNVAAGMTNSWRQIVRNRITVCVEYSRDGIASNGSVY